MYSCLCQEMYELWDTLATVYICSLYLSIIYTDIIQNVHSIHSSSWLVSVISWMFVRADCLRFVICHPLCVWLFVTSCFCFLIFDIGVQRSRASVFVVFFFFCLVLSACLTQWHLSLALASKAKQHETHPVKFLAVLVEKVDFSLYLKMVIWSLW